MPYPIIKADAEGIAHAAAVIRAGEPVVAPTETVYGVMADAANPEAIRKLYRIKQRSGIQPLQVLVQDFSAAKRLGRFDARAEKLAQGFWPGSLTLIVPCHEEVPIAEEVLAGGKTIGLRVPDHEVMQALLKKISTPLAASSANRAGEAAPRTAAEVDIAVTLILDGGACALGVASTVLDLSMEMPKLLREGSIAGQHIERVSGISLR